MENERSLGNNGICDRTSRVPLLVNYTEGQKLRILNTHLKKKQTRKWPGICPNGIHSEIDLIIAPHINTELKI